MIDLSNLIKQLSNWYAIFDFLVRINFDQTKLENANTRGNHSLFCSCSFFHFSHWFVCIFCKRTRYDSLLHHKHGLFVFHTFEPLSYPIRLTFHTCPVIFFSLLRTKDRLRPTASAPLCSPSTSLSTLHFHYSHFSLFGPSPIILSRSASPSLTFRCLLSSGARSSVVDCRGLSAFVSITSGSSSFARVTFWPHFR